jgi:hypothetical protein
VDVVLFTGADVLHTQVAVPVLVGIIADVMVLAFVVMVADMVQLEPIRAAANRVSLMVRQRSTGQRQGEDGDEGKDEEDFFHEGLLYWLKVGRLKVL